VGPLGIAEPPPLAEPRQHPLRHEQRGRKGIGELFDAAAAILAHVLDLIGRHRVPRQKVEELVREIEIPTTRIPVAVDEHSVKF
jgi:hypothetical protein